MALLTPEQREACISRVAIHIQKEKNHRNRLFETDQEEWLEALESLSPTPDEAELRKVARTLKRRSSQNSAEGKGSGYWASFSNTNHLMGWLLHRGKCAYCESDLDLIAEGYIRDKRAHSDHLIPSSLCPKGNRDYLNIVPACDVCNSIKWYMDPREDALNTGAQI
jgi:5-methylcytosine-specific restriction endonuclease McrA